MKNRLFALLTLLLFTSSSAYAKEYPTWNEINQDICNLCDQIDSDQVDVLLGICAGGLAPTTMFSKYLKNKNIQVISTESYSEDDIHGELKIWNLPSQESLANQRVLIVDDIADSGITVQRVKELLLSDYAVESVEIATVYVNTDHCFAYPDYWAQETQDWIVFPWEILYEPTTFPAQEDTD